MPRSPETIRNLALIGQNASGKTTLLEHLLFKAGAIPRLGKIEDGTSVLDYDDLERERRHTIDPKVAFFEKDGVLVHLIDTPGYRDLLGHIFGPLMAVEAAVLVVDADEGVRPYTRKLWQLIERNNLPRFVVINRLDREHARFEEILDQLHKLSPKCVPMTVPVGLGPSLSGVESSFGAAKGKSELARTYGESFMETVIETNEELLEKYLGGEEISSAVLDQQLAEAIQKRGIFPVLSASGAKDLGLAELVQALVKYAPPASTDLGRTAHLFDKPEEKAALKSSSGEPLCGFVFRSVSDPYVGKLTITRLLSGSVAQNGLFINPHTGKTEKIGKLVRLQGKEQVPVESAGAGEIVALLKVEALKCFDTIATGEKRLVIDHPKLPTPMYGRALEPKTKTDEKKFSEAIAKVTDEDPGVVAKRDHRTNEMVVSGSSQLHLLIVIQRLKNRFNVEVNTKDPKIPYLETITAKGDDKYRHKKQTGGAGEFAEVWMRVEPLPRGGGYEFANDVFGGAIAESYVTSAEKGVKVVMEQGVIAGYPVVDVKVTVYDGKEHPVDSKDVAFQKAGREAFKLAVRQAKPVLLEPIVNLEVTFPAEAMGDITGDLNRRRARVNGMDSDGEFQTIRAQVPLAEISEYSNTLGAMTGGQGTYEIEMSHYEVAPGNVQQKIIEMAARAHQEKKEED
ncbi:MAG: elongation factor G [Planctomycetes bacterium]|nr:elongation factor G [Planctomycetota bacterium]